jgi:Xaa-Pro aminopeptidase
MNVMTKPKPDLTDTVVTEADLAEGERRLALLREVMREQGFDAFIVNDGGNMGGHGGFQSQPVQYLTNFWLPTIPLNVVVPLEGEAALIMKPGFDYSFVREAERQSWIRNVIGLDMATDITALEATEAKTETANAIADVLKKAGIEGGHFAVLGGDWPGLAELKELLPEAEFEAVATPSWLSTIGGSFGRLAEKTRSFGDMYREVSDWQINRLEEATDAGYAAILDYIAAARRGKTILEAHREAVAAATIAGADAIQMYGTINADPWRYWTISSASPDVTFKSGQMYLIQCGNVAVKGYSSQMARTFVVGEPTKAQQRVMDMMRATHELIVAESKIGRAGKEIWAMVEPMLKKEGLEAWSQFGHTMGIGKIMSYSDVMGPWSDGVIAENMVITVHPCIYDPETGDHGMTSDCYIVKNGEMRNLARNPLPHTLF